jgi:hypothetical protein
LTKLKTLPPGFMELQSLKEQLDLWGGMVCQAPLPKLFWSWALGTRKRMAASSAAHREIPFKALGMRRKSVMRFLHGTYAGEGVWRRQVSEWEVRRVLRAMWEISRVEKISKAFRRLYSLKISFYIVFFICFITIRFVLSASPWSRVTYVVNKRRLRRYPPHE